MVEGGALVDKKRLRPAQPSQKVALVKSNVELLNNVTERKKETSGSRWWQRDGAGPQSLKSRSKRSACGDLIMKIDFDVEAVNLTIMMIVVIVVFVIIFLHFH